MNEKSIRKYANLMKELGLTGIEITEKDKKLRLESMGNAVDSVIPTSIVQTNKPEPLSTEKDYKSIKSPFVGVFYASPTENGEPYVVEGKKISKGQILCIIEAMKLMNELPSEFDGEICKVCVSNGQVVEYGTELFRIKEATYE